MESKSLGEDCNISIEEREEWKKFNIKEIYRNHNLDKLKFKTPLLVLAVQRPFPVFI
jgi:hypothetical protein